MTEAVLAGGYRVAMGTAAALAAVFSRVPGAPESWRGLRDRLGRLSDEGLATASSAPAMWLHAASVGELTASRPLLRRLRERFPERLLAISTATRTGLELAHSMPETHLAFLLPLDAVASPSSLRRPSRSRSPRHDSGAPGRRETTPASAAAVPIPTR